MEVNDFEFEKISKTALRTFADFHSVENLFVKDESENPFGTFKDRLAFKLIADVYKLISISSDSNTLKKELQRLKPKTFGVITLGNTSFPLGKYIEKINSVSQSFINKEIFRLISFTYHDKDDRLIGPDTYGNTCSGIDVINRLKDTGIVRRLNLEEKFYDSRLLEEIARKEDLVIGDFQDITNGIEMGGKKYPAYQEIFVEIIADLNYTPDYVIVPSGTGILYNEFCDYIISKKLKTRIVGVTVTKPESIADKLYGFYWQDIEKLKKDGFYITSYGEEHLMLCVNDDEIIKVLGELKGRINAEPSGAAGFPVINRLGNFYPSFKPEKDTIVIVNTGNGIPNFIATDKLRGQ
jgi:threonine synthase